MHLSYEYIFEGSVQFKYIFVLTLNIERSTYRMLYKDEERKKGKKEGREENIILIDNSLDTFYAKFQDWFPRFCNQGNLVRSFSSQTLFLNEF